MLANEIAGKSLPNGSSEPAANLDVATTNQDPPKLRNSSAKRRWIAEQNLLQTQRRGEIYSSTTPRSIPYTTPSFTRPSSFDDDEPSLSAEAEVLRKEIEKLHPEHSIIQAYRCEESSFHHLDALIGCFPDGFFVTLLDNNHQYFCDAGGIVASSFEWIKESTADDEVLYIRHFYPESGCYVYTTGTVQFLVCP
jgi:hypothetical protein